MKISITTLTLAALVSSQSLPTNLPACAQSCALPYFTSNESSFANCDSRDVACICTNDAFVAAISCCIFTNCSMEDQTAVVEFVHNLCSQVVIPGTPGLPSSASCPSAITTAPTTVSTSTLVPAPMTTAPTVYKIRGARY